MRLEAVLRVAFQARGIPERLYVDNGAPYASRQLARICAVLGVRLIHSTPGRPQGRGKIERFFRTLRQELLVELERTPGPSEGKSRQAAASRGSIVTWCPSAWRRRTRLRVARSGFWRV